MPHLQKIYDKYKNQNFSMISINTVPSQNEMIPDWRAKGKYTFPILVGATQELLSQNYNYQGSPTNFLVNADGKVFFKHLGYGPGAEKVMEAEIREMLGLDPFEGIKLEVEQKPKDTKESVSSP